MVVDSSDRLDSIFHALSDRTRRAMVARLTEREQTVGELAAPFAMSLAGASKHVRVLEEAGLIRRTVKGRTHLCSLDREALSEAEAWIQRTTRFWNERLDALERELLAELNDNPHGEGR